MSASTDTNDKQEESVVASANRFVDALVAGRMEDVEGVIDPRAASQMNSATLRAAWSRIESSFGAYKNRLSARVEALGPYKAVFVPAVFERATMDLKVVCLQDGRVSGFFIEPHKEGFKRADYDHPQMYQEKEVSIGIEPFKLAGTLSIPKDGGPFPVVVLVHGSGPHDRDESIGSSKPFRDLAHGLACKGIAVLRYEKRTRAYQEKMARQMKSGFTVDDETVDDALHAVEVLAARPESERIDRRRIFVLGHSLGGMMIPRLASMTTTAAGFISMAGSNRPLTSMMIDQADYLIALGGDDAGEWQKKRADFVNGAEKIDSLESGSAEAVEGKSILGAPPSYWLDLKKYDPLAEVRKIKRPVLFLQGEKDYQVTASGDFQNWKEAVKDLEGSDTRFRFELYPGLDHLFMPVEGKSKPADYFGPTRHVDPKVIDDIASFVDASN
ncbi:MAG: alpha/beta fold hydrolase [Cyanobacteria bacterium HKST-UBA02]|nr:alpha/beta fold hydrolase [Cyanobacteria bacterium HKST-UBA02]